MRCSYGLLKPPDMTVTAKACLDRLGQALSLSDSCRCWCGASACAAIMVTTKAKSPFQSLGYPQSMTPAILAFTGCLMLGGDDQLTWDTSC